MITIIKHTVGNVSEEVLKVSEKQMEEQLPSDMPFILAIKYYPNTQIMEVIRVEDKP